MSMLLEALKKAALEKKTRLEQKTVLSNLAEAHRHQHIVSTQPAEPAEKARSETEATAPDNLVESAATLLGPEENPKTFEYELTETPPESDEVIHDMSDEIDLSDIDQTPDEDLLNDVEPEPEQVKETQLDAQQSKEALIASIVEDALSQTEEKNQEINTAPEKNKVQTKEAFSRLIEKSKSREKIQNRRLIVVSSSFVIVSMTLAILYYLFLSANESDFLVPSGQVSPSGHIETEEGIEPEVSGLAETDAPNAQEQDPPTESTIATVQAQAAIAKELPTGLSTTTSPKISTTKSPTKSNRLASGDTVAANPASNRPQTPNVIQMEPLPEKIQLAYQAYQNGNIEGAMELYQQAYAISPENIDVLLGLAACTVQLNKAEDALHYYQQVLRINSKDRTALAGLLSITSTQANDPEIESRLRILINENPGDAHLYFLMGNLYLSHLNWGAANTQFSKAVSLESHNPNYLYNLAISYDQLGQPASALRYYQQAQSSAKSGQANFSLQKLNSRIDILQQQLQ